MGNRPDCDCGCLLRIDDGKRESPKQKSPGVVLADGPALGGLAGRIGGPMQFFDEIQGGFAAVLLIPGNCAFNIRGRALVVLNALSAH